MLDSLKQAGKNIGRELGRTWENLSEGWRELQNGVLSIRLPKVAGENGKTIPVS